MPHTNSRYQQSLGFTDGMFSCSANDFSGFASAGSAPAVARNAVGDIVWIVQSSSTAILACDLFRGMTRRSGYFEDTQNVFGSTFGSGLGGVAAGSGGVSGTGIPASAAVQGRPDSMILPGTPQPASAMSALQPIVPRTGLKIKGVKLLSMNVIYSVVTGAATALTCSLTQSIFVNGVAIAKTTLLANAANGLQNVNAATPYVTNIPLPLATYYQITPNTQLWFEVACQEPASNTFQLSGLELFCEFNYN